jgi:hypothetical protein
LTGKADDNEQHYCFVPNRWIVKKIIVLFVLAAFAAAPAAAAAKKKRPAAQTPKSPQEMSFNDAMAYNKKNLSLIVQGLPLILPSWSLPIVFGLQKHDDNTRHEGKKR